MRLCSFARDKFDRTVPVLEIAPLRATLLDPEEIGACPDEIVVIRVDRHEEAPPSGVFADS
jgi:hypothetical protein